jgi:NAD(P)-dependent dehydrogenase (short-subunit alcohol dehydrogenase family)
MSSRLDGKVAVVTGGGNGIGRACCLRFADEGADVIVADIQEEPGAETVGAVKERGREALFVRVDTRSEEDNETMAATAVERFGKIDILVTAAGISHQDYVSGDKQATQQMIERAMADMGSPAAALANLDMAGWQRVLDVNLTGTLLGIRAVAERMAASGGGSIVTIASIAAKRPDAGPLAYAVSKAGVWMLTKSTARSLGPVGIRVNAIGPGYIDTNMTAFLTENEMIKQMAMTQIPLGRIGTPTDVANTALFLASDESSYFTGEILHPDGGFYTE